MRRRGLEGSVSFVQGAAVQGVKLAPIRITRPGDGVDPSPHDEHRRRPSNTELSGELVVRLDALGDDDGFHVRYQLVGRQAEFYGDAAVIEGPEILLIGEESIVHRPERLASALQSGGLCSTGSAAG